MCKSRTSTILFSFLKINFKKHPIIANGIIYGTLFSGAEYSQQVLTRKVFTVEPNNLDLKSLARYALFGTAIQGPLLTIWFKWLDTKYVGRSLNVVAKKLVLDQTIAASAELVLFYVAMSALEGKRNADVLEECRSKFVESYKSSCIFWIPAQIVNFAMVPPAFRVIYLGIASFAWVNVLCYIKRQTY